MNGKIRVPMQVDPSFKKKIEELQIKIRKKTGRNESMKTITGKISKSPDFEKLEKNLLNLGENMGIKLNLDMRKKWEVY